MKMALEQQLSELEAPAQPELRYLDSLLAIELGEADMQDEMYSTLDIGMLFDTEEEADEFRELNFD